MEEGSIDGEHSCETESSDDHRDTLSLFGASSSGEPLVAQLLAVDFTPTAADTAYIKSKIIAFWDYIYTRKDLRSFRVKPDVGKVVEERSDVDVDLESSETLVQPELTRKQSTAVSMLEFVEGKGKGASLGLINRIFEAKLQQSWCSLGAREYQEEDPINKRVQKQDGAVCSTSQTSCHVESRSQGGKKTVSVHPGRDSHHVYNLCRTLESWDKHHPKSMAEPGHPPNLSYLPDVLRKIDFL